MEPALLGLVVEPAGGQIAGAIIFGVAGGVTGFGAGVIGGSFREIGREYLYDHSLLGFGDTYQKQLQQNIASRCGSIP